MMSLVLNSGPMTTFWLVFDNETKISFVSSVIHSLCIAHAVAIVADECTDIDVLRRGKDMSETDNPELILQELSESGVLRLTLNDNGRRNALSEAMLKCLGDLMISTANDPVVHRWLRFPVMFQTNTLWKCC